MIGFYVLFGQKADYQSPKFNSFLANSIKLKEFQDLSDTIYSGGKIIFNYQEVNSFKSLEDYIPLFDLGSDVTFEERNKFGDIHPCYISANVCPIHDNSLNPCHSRAIPVRLSYCFYVILRFRLGDSDSLSFIPKQITYLCKKNK